MTEPDSEPQLIAGFAQVLLEEAGRAAARSSGAPFHLHAEVAGAAAAAVLLAGAALEAALSEYATIAAEPGHVGPPLDVTDLDVIRDGKDPLHTRYQKLVSVYSSATMCQDIEEFKNLRCLVELRNAFAHRRAEFLKLGDWPVGLHNCRGRIPFFKDGVYDWTSVLLIPNVAQWAVKTARARLVWLRPLLPDFQGSPLRLMPAAGALPNQPLELSGAPGASARDTHGAVPPEVEE